MGLSRSTASWIAPLSFTINFAAQLFGILSSPNMADIHYANISFWSPQPIFVAIIFFPLQLCQLAWLYTLLKFDSKENAEKRVEMEQLADYIPFYSLGNLCIAVWMIFWNRSELKIANIFVLINSLTQLYYIFGRLPAMKKDSIFSILTHIISKILAGIGILDLLHNGSAAYFTHGTPTISIKILTGIIFSALASRSDWIFGGCLVYDLVALSVGQRNNGERIWSDLLAVYAVGTALIVGMENYLRSPCTKQDLGGYESFDTNIVTS